MIKGFNVKLGSWHGIDKYIWQYSLTLRLNNGRHYMNIHISLIYTYYPHKLVWELTIVSI